RKLSSDDFIDVLVDLLAIRRVPKFIRVAKTAESESLIPRMSKCWNQHPRSQAWPTQLLFIHQKELSPSQAVMDRSLAFTFPSNSGPFRYNNGLTSRERRNLSCCPPADNT
ncbi:hypothetical protein OAL43_03250, partial [bacterium]|nr:hypothetical protein [bacterium]